MNRTQEVDESHPQLTTGVGSKLSAHTKRAAVKSVGMGHFGDSVTRRTVEEVEMACVGLERGPHPTQSFLLSGPLHLDPAQIQRLSANLAFLTVTDASGARCELIAKCRDGFLAPLDIDVLCTACSTLSEVEVFPEVPLSLLFSHRLCTPSSFAFSFSACPLSLCLTGWIMKITRQLFWLESENSGDFRWLC